MAQHPRLLFGGAAIGDAFKTADNVSELLKTLRSLGINTIDTAGRYPPLNQGASETLLGQVGALEQGFTVDTKIYHDAGTGAGLLKPAAVEKSLATSCERLGVKPGGEHKLNVLYCHGPDPETPLEEQALGLQAQYEKGLFRELGVSNWKADMLSEFLDICDRKGFVKPTVYEGNYSILRRSAEKDLFPLLRRHSIRFEAYSVLSAGFLSGKFTAGEIKGTRFDQDTVIGKFATKLFDKQEMHDAIHAFTKLLEAKNMSKVEAALRWVSYHSALGPEDGIILGASKLEQIVSSVEAIKKGPLPDDVVAAMDGLWMTVPQQL